MFEKKGNLIGEFDASRVSVEKDHETREFDHEIVWYDITDIVRKLDDSMGLPVMKYISKIEVEVCETYGVPVDIMTYAQEEYEQTIYEEFDKLGIFIFDGNLDIRNDGRGIKLTFLNGSRMEFSNSEWGHLFLCSDSNVEKEKPAKGGSH